MPAEYKNYAVEYSSGRGSVRVRKGRSACPEFWSAVDAAEAAGATYCGYHHGHTDPCDMVATYQCRSCYEDRMVGFTTYRPPSLRQSYRDICPREERVAEGTCRDDPVALRAAWDQYRAEDAAKAARQEQRAEALRLLAEFKAEDSPPREKKSTPVEVEQEPDYGLYDEQTAANLVRLREQLSNGEIG